MAKYHAAAGGQGGDGGHKIVPLAFITEQPHGGQGPKVRQAGQRRVAARHILAYSGAMLDNEPTENRAPENKAPENRAPENRVVARLAHVQTRIAAAAARAGRTPEAIELVAISKTQSAAAIADLIAAGQCSFGENRMQEALDKWPSLRAGPGRDVRLHFVGRLQSNKAADAVRFFDAIHSVDRPSLVRALAREVAQQDRRPDLFVQVNIGEEAQKGGCAIADTPFLIASMRTLGIPPAGLMCVPPVGVEAAPFFALLREIAQMNGLSGLSMGMSGDYETAVMLGATHVRVGSALFGPRAAPPEAPGEKA